ncbi:MAG: NAD-dependent epimerase/dehydratase family protein [Acidimicrobiales bacterium]
MRALAKAVVLGGHGFLGQWLVRELLEGGTAVTVIDRSEAPPGAEWSSLVGPLEGVDLAGVFHDELPEVVFHLASPAFVPPSLLDPVGDLLGSVASTIALLEAARCCVHPPAVVLLSSAAVYGGAEFVPMTEDHPLAPMSPYGVAKLAAEEYLRLYHRIYDISCFAVRPFSLYGPGQRKLFVFDLIRRVLEGENPCVIHGRSDVTRDLLYVRDAVRSIVTLARNAPGRAESYNLGSGEAVSLAELAEAIIAATGLPTSFAFTGEARAGDPLHWTADVSRARALGAEAATPLGEGLRDTVAWVRDVVADR